MLALGGRELEARKLWSFPRSGQEHPSPQAHTRRRCQEPSAPKAPGLRTKQRAGVDWVSNHASALRPTIRARRLGSRGRRRSCVSTPGHPALWRECLIRWPWSILLRVRRLRSQHRTELCSHTLNQGGGAAAPRLGALRGLFSIHHSAHGARSHHHSVPGSLYQPGMCSPLRPCQAGS